MEIVVPQAAGAVMPTPPAHRASANLNKVWGFIDTSKVNADVFVDESRKAIRERHGAESIVIHKSRPGVGLTDDELDQLVSKCAVVVACFGD